MFALKSISQQTRIAEVGYWLNHRVHGNGIIGEILRHINQLAVINVLEFKCLAQNIASIKIAKKFGAMPISTAPNFIIADGINQDLITFQKELKRP